MSGKNYDKGLSSPICTVRSIISQKKKTSSNPDDIFYGFKDLFFMEKNLISL